VFDEYGASQNNTVLIFAFRRVYDCPIVCRGVLATGLVLALAPASAESQRALDRMKKRAEQSTTPTIVDRVNRKTDAGIDEMFDGAESAISCLATDQACIQKAEKTGDAVFLTHAYGKELSRKTAASKASATKAGATTG